jgi:DNA (cytosine-5)-methyltransferase 1
MLENVKNLVGKKFRAQFDEWCDWLDGIGYNTYWQVLNAKDYGVPQNRERVFAVSVRKDIDDGNFRFPDKKFLDIRLKDILEDEVDEKYYLSDKILRGFKAHNERHAEKGTGFIFKPRDTDGIASTIRANSSLCPTDNAVCIQAGSLNHYNGAMVANDSRIRRLTPLECWRLMGFTDEAFRKAEAVCSNSQLYKQAGNSIVVDALVGIFKNLFRED